MARLIALLLILSLSASLIAENKAPRAGNSRGYKTDILVDTFGFGQDDIDAPMDKVFQGCGRRDCIPAIDSPRFVAVAEVDFLEEDDLVLSVSYQGITRAYATRILDVHEIVNDRFEQVPVLVSYCPLCGSGLAFVRELDGEAVEFGVSGLLHNNDLIMYDRKSESLWQQITGRSIGGPSRGQLLEPVPLTMSLWRDWRAQNPDARVLAFPDAPEHYAKRHYTDYESSDRLLFPVTAQSARLKPKRIIFGIEAGEESIAIDAEWLSEERHWSHAVDAGEIHVEMSKDGGVTGTLAGKAIPVHRMFWFAWYSFHPTTALID